MQPCEVQAAAIRKDAMIAVLRYCGAILGPLVGHWSGIGPSLERHLQRFALHAHRRRRGRRHELGSIWGIRIYQMCSSKSLVNRAIPISLGKPYLIV